MSQTKTIDLKKLIRSSEQNQSQDRSSTLGLVEAIAKLLSSHDLRSQFEQAPALVAQQIGISSEDFEAFVALSPDQLDRQANTLLNKRWHEVRRLVPLTIDSLGREAVEVFRFYATNDWPIGHRRHPVDAFRFLQFLMANRIAEPNKMELKRMRRINSVSN